MDAEAEKTEGATELAFAHLRNAVAHHDQEAVASISYRLLTGGHNFEVILKEAVSAVNRSQEQTIAPVENNLSAHRRFRYAHLVLSGLFVILPTGVLDLSQTRSVSETKIGMDKATHVRSEQAKWAQYIQNIAQAIGDGGQTSHVVAKNAVAGPLRIHEPKSPDRVLPLPETAGQKDPAVHAPLNVDAPGPLPNVVQVQSDLSATQPSDGTAVDLQSYISHGDHLFADGDVAGARVFYRRAAEYGNPIAAERLGGTYDPKILAQGGLTGSFANQETAQHWYRRAQELRDKNNH
jgi:hypothetical protein